MACSADGGFSVAAIRQALSSDHPDLTSERTPTGFSANGHTLSYDGRLIVAAVAADETSTTWQVRVFRPEALSYATDGRPSFQTAFSAGRSLAVTNGENALALCATSASQIGRLEGGFAIYDPYIIESRMMAPSTEPPPAGTPPHEVETGHFRRRTFQARVANPGTATAEVADVTSGPLEYLFTTSGNTLRGLEPTMTADGRLLVFQGAPSNDGTIDHLMYSFNPSPCAATGWTTPQPLHMMRSDPTPGVRDYPLAWRALLAASGEPFDATNPLHGAYAWIDPEGRNLLYLAAPGHDGRREAVTLIGADVDHTAYAIDGGINLDRSFAKLFYTSPMWEFERGQPGGSFDSHYLPVSDPHDVLPVFGSNSADYNEVDLGNVEHPSDFVYLDMFPLVTRAGEFDFRHSADHSALLHEVALEGDAALVPSAPASSGAHPRGHVAALGGAGQLRIGPGPVPVKFQGTMRGFTLQLAINPDPQLASACPDSVNPWRYLVDAPGNFHLIYEANGSVQLTLYIDGQEVRLGWSPVLPRGSWSHVAYSWDGVSGRFHEYINGLDTGRVLPRFAGSLVRPVEIAVGSALPRSPDTCADQGGLSFIGQLDELRLFVQARTQRSVCMAALGADCGEQAIQGEPSTGQFLLSQLHPECLAPDMLNSLACRSALHRFCAQRGARDALASASNVLDTARQLISARPPVSLAGVATAASTRNATVACMPLAHETFPIDYHELAEHHEGCTSERMFPLLQCEAAAHRVCNEIGFTSGHLFEGTTRAWINCFDAAQTFAVAAAALGPSCGAGAWETAECRLEVSRYCQQQGHGAGVAQELAAGVTVDVHCFDPAATVQAAFSTPFERWATRQGAFAAHQFWLTGDFNRDERDDLARVWSDAGSNSIDVQLSSGQAFTLQRWATRQSSYSTAHRWLSGDFNRDGRGDLARVWDDKGRASIDVFVSNGTRFTLQQRWANRQGAYAAAQRWLSGDFNGDGRDDLAKVSDDQGRASIDVFVSNGARFTQQRWATALGPFAPAQRWLAGDFDADGRGDLAVVFDELGRVSGDAYWSTGSSLVKTRLFMQVAPYAASSEWRVADYDGDGNSDLAELRDDAGAVTVDLLRTEQGELVSERWGARLEPFDPSQPWLAADFAGDGKAELVRLSADQAMLTADVWVP